MIKISRERWGAQRPTEPSPGLDADSITFTQLSQTESFNHPDCPIYVQEAQQNDFLSGLTDIGFNWVICQHGYCYEGRGHGIYHGQPDQAISTSEYVLLFGIISDPMKYAAKELAAEVGEAWFDTGSDELADWITNSMPTVTPVFRPPLQPDDEVTVPTPAIVVQDDGTRWFFVKGAYEDGMPPNCGKLWYNNTGDPADWSNLGGEITSGPGAFLETSGRITVVARARDGSLVSIERNTTGEWSDWINIGGRT